MEQRITTWKWHNFMTGFGLIATAIMNVLSAIWMLYLDVTGQASGMAIPIVVSGIVALIAYFTIDELKRKRETGILLLLFLYGFSAAANVVMCLFVPDAAGSYLVNAALNAGMLFLNNQYYTKRSEYFTD